ncbi:MAG: sulfatase-like hydrolase/transferase [Fimbriimonadaceae bacterium]|nr:sulfatase-like hydrolase/transferase [Fimbriimonadaceae bacterium]
MPATRRPNILVFFTDQQRWDTVGAYHSPLDLTPHLDAAARRGTTFLNAFTCQPVCGPARSCLQSGRYATQTGCWRNSIPLRRDEVTIGHHLAQAGYRTGYLGKWHLAETGTAPVPLEQRGGWTEFWEAADILEFVSHPDDFRVYDRDNALVTEPGYRVDAQTNRALHFVRQPPAEPWCLLISYLEPHHQNDLRRHVAPDGYAARYRDAWVPGDLRALPGNWRQEWADYCGCIASLDENYGRLTAALAETGQLDDTVVIFVTDHGSHFCTRNAEYKRSCHEASVHIPLVISGPGFDHGRRAEELVSLLDVPATICGVAGLAVPPAMQGRDLAPLARGPVDPWRDEVLIQISESCTARAVRTARWKYAITAPPGPQTGASLVYQESHLYDLWADPHELVNLVGRPAWRAQADDLQQRLLRQMAAAGEATPEILAARFLG